jgi:FlaG/FlaF family flagellin (archaellin)
MRERGPAGGGRLRRDDRAASVTVGYVLTLAIGAVLLSGIVIGIGGVVDSQTERVVRGDLAVVGQTAVANLESADRLARASEVDHPSGAAAPNVSVDVDLPTRLAGRPYRIAVDGDTVTLRTDDPEAVTEISHVATLPVETSTVRGGPIRISYDGDAGRLEVTER